MLVFVSCDSKVKQGTQLEAVRDSLAVMKSYDIVTLISDSGLTRYRLIAKQWFVYDKIKHPKWIFPKGLHLDQFDKNFSVNSEIEADSAVYLVDLKQWILIGNVNAVNVKDETFETPLLFVEQENDKIYTDSIIKITQGKSKIINGVGFRSNQSLTQYTILKPTGIIPLDEEDSDSTKNISKVDTLNIDSNKINN